MHRWTGSDRLGFKIFLLPSRLRKFASQHANSPCRYRKCNVSAGTGDKVRRNLEPNIDDSNQRHRRQSGGQPELQLEITRFVGWADEIMIWDPACQSQLHAQAHASEKSCHTSYGRDLCPASDAGTESRACANSQGWRCLAMC